REHPFTQIANAALRDRHLSFRARGILAYVLSHQDDWRHSSESLMAQGREGRGAVRSALQELEENGYCMRVRYRDAQGRLKTRLDWAESPTTENRSSVSRSSVSRSSIEHSQPKTMKKIQTTQTTVPPGEGTEG